MDYQLDIMDKYFQDNTFRVSLKRTSENVPQQSTSSIPVPQNTTKPSSSNSNNNNNYNKNYRGNSHHSSKIGELFVLPPMPKTPE